LALAIILWSKLGFGIMIRNQGSLS